MAQASQLTATPSWASLMRCCRPLLAWIGPAIGPAVYGVGPDVFEAVTRVAGDASVFLPGKVDGKWYLDLFALTALLLA